LIKLFFLNLILLLIGIAYFVPFTVYIQSKFKERIDMNSLIAEMGLSTISYSTQLALLFGEMNSILHNEPFFLRNQLQLTLDRF